MCPHPQQPPVWKWGSEETLSVRPSTASPTSAAPTPTQAQPSSRPPWATEDTPQHRPSTAYNPTPYHPSPNNEWQARPSTASARSSAPWATEEDLPPPTSFQPGAGAQARPVSRPYATQASPSQPAPAPFAPNAPPQRNYPWSWQQ